MKNLAKNAADSEAERRAKENGRAAIGGTKADAGASKRMKRQAGLGTEKHAGNGAGAKRPAGEAGAKRLADESRRTAAKGTPAKGTKAAKQARRHTGAAGSSGRRRIWIWSACGAAVVLAIVFGVAAIRSQEGTPGPFDVVATVNGEPISYGEFAHELNADRAAVLGYFKEKYGTEYSPDFWTTAAGGELPLDRVEKLALAASVRRKVQQLEAKKLGLTADIGYRTLLRTMKKTNAEREAKVKRNEVVYGPVTFDEQRYIDDDGQRLGQALLEKLQPGFGITDAAIAAYYDENKAKFGLGDSRTIRAIEVVFADEQARKEGIDGARSKLNDIARELSAGTKFGEVYDRLSGDAGSGFTVSERVYDYRTPRTESITRPALTEAVNKLAAGETTGIIEDGLTIGIYACTDEKPLGTTPLADVKAQIVKDLAAADYGHYVDGLQQAAKVEVDDRIMAKVEMQE